ncbi:MAG: hypothetical protein ACTHKG_19350 [Nocardioides sp.]
MRISELLGRDVVGPDGAAWATVVDVHVDAPVPAGRGSAGPWSVAGLVLAPAPTSTWTAWLHFTGLTQARVAGPLRPLARGARAQARYLAARDVARWSGEALVAEPVRARPLEEVDR